MHKIQPPHLENFLNLQKLILTLLYMDMLFLLIVMITEFLSKG